MSKKRSFGVEKTAMLCVDTAKKEGVGVILTCDGFITDKEAIVLRNLCWYACSQGVDVIVSSERSSMPSDADYFSIEDTGEVEIGGTLELEIKG